MKLDYLFLDGSFFRYHVGAAAEPVLAAWGIDTSGKPAFVGLAATGSGESGDAWAGFLTELGDRGLACPLLVISDGAAGLIAAVEQDHARRAAPTMPDPPGPEHRRQGPAKHAQADVKADYWKIFDVPGTSSRRPDRAVDLVDASASTSSPPAGATPTPPRSSALLTDPTA